MSPALTTEPQPRDGAVSPQSTLWYDGSRQDQGVEAVGSRTVVLPSSHQHVYQEVPRHRAGGHHSNQRSPQGAAPRYRTTFTIYHDGGRTRIEETSRHSQRSNSGVDRSRGRKVGIVQASNGSNLSIAPFYPLGQKEGHNTSRSSEAHLDAPGQRSKTRPIVIHTIAVTEISSLKRNAANSGGEPLTPPLTPELGRLPTPNLPDLDEKVCLCECCPAHGKARICEA